MRCRAAAAAMPLVAALVTAVLAAAAAQGDAAVFHGKEISVFIGAGAGGGADTYARLLARHYGRHLPGNPAVVAKNLPGAGGIRLATQLYNVSPRDGTEIGTFQTSVALEPLFGSKEARFETDKFTWIGNMTSDPTACMTWRHTGVKTWQDLKNRVTTFGASGPASGAAIYSEAMAALLGVRIKVIYGYQGTRSSNLAMQRGELDGQCGLYLSTVRSTFGDQVRSGDLTVWLTSGKERAKDFPDVPTIFELVKSEEDRALAGLVFGQDATSRPIAAPPGLSAEVATALRRGFMATLADPAFLAEAGKMSLDIEPMTGEETQRRFAEFYRTPRPVIERAKAIMGRKSE
jgi:tripartite-type tricarboxylate transporter receptor subunit TctC